jgi:hypothetical protein
MSMKRIKEIVYSEPVQEIMGTPPRRLIAWGTTILFFIFMLFIMASIFIRYPDVIPAPIEITTRIPPATLNSKVTGKIDTLLAGDKQSIEKNGVIAVLESAADWLRVLEVESSISGDILLSSLSPSSFPGSLMLGELQSSYTRFTSAYSRWYSSTQNDHMLQRIESLRSESKSIDSYIERLKVKEGLLIRDVALDNDRFRRDSLMHKEGVIADSDFERSLQAHINRKMELQNVSLEIMAKLIERERKEQEIQELSLFRRDEFQELESVAIGTLNDLRADIEMWKNRYLLMAPFSGTVSYTRFWTSNQYVNEGDAVVTVVPDNQGEYIGRVVMGPFKSGKVKQGMPVNIKLDGFPYLEYGMLRGVVRSISMVPDEREYIVEVELPQGLVTNYGEKLEFPHNMSGRAEIRSDDFNLITRLVAPLRHLITLQQR